MKLLDEAAAAFARAVELRPEVEELSLALFHVLWQNGTLIEATEEAKRFVSRCGFSEQYKLLFDEINRGDDTQK